MVIPASAFIWTHIHQVLEKFETIFFRPLLLLGFHSTPLSLGQETTGA